jgi:hypothetical protein
MNRTLRRKSPQQRNQSNYKEHDEHKGHKVIRFELHSAFVPFVTFEV